ncbi:hypothetical protein [Dactylosporangium cerinum]
MGLYTPASARLELARLRPLLDELVTVRADTAELAASLAPGVTRPRSADCPSTRRAPPGSTSW